MKITTSRFGVLEIEDDKVIALPDGMVGFSETRFILLNPDKWPFFWFQSVDNPDLAFVVVDPTQFLPDYRVRLTREEYDKLMLEPGEEMGLLTVATMSADPRQITINLQGPIVLNPARSLARQVVLDGNHPTRYRLFAPKEDVAGEKRTTSFSISTFYSDLGLALACP